jgi:hypothetical protein
MPHNPSHILPGPTIEEQFQVGATPAAKPKQFGMQTSGAFETDATTTGGVQPGAVATLPTQPMGGMDELFQVGATQPTPPGTTQPMGGMDQLFQVGATQGSLLEEEKQAMSSAAFDFGKLDATPGSALANFNIGEFQRLAEIGQYGAQQRGQLFEVERELLNDIQKNQEEATAMSSSIQQLLLSGSPIKFDLTQDDLMAAGKAMAKADVARQRLQALQDLRTRLDTLNQRGLQQATFPQVGALSGLLSNLFGVGPEAFEGLQNLPTSAVSGLIPMLFQQGQAAQRAGVEQRQREAEQLQRQELGSALQSLYPTMQGVQAFGAFPSLVPQLFGREAQTRDIGFQQREAELGRGEAALERGLRQQQIEQQGTQFQAQIAEQQAQRMQQSTEFARQMELAEGQQTQAATEFTEQIRQFNEGLDLSKDELDQRIQEWTDKYDLSELQETRLRDRLTMEQDNAAIDQAARSDAFVEQVRQFNVGVRLQDDQIDARAKEFADQFELSETQENRLRDRLSMEQEFADRQAAEQQRLIEQQATQTEQMGGLAGLIGGMSGIPGLGQQQQGLALQPQLLSLLLQQALGGGRQQGMMRTAFR